MGLQMSLIFDPRFFNVLIVFMFVAAAVRWAFERNWAQATYWLAAAVLNVAVTCMGVK